ncbi:L,D-transpeptidase family protein [Methylocystis sp. WRRC1]|uniref:L,D-transpeptidase family protein n=1 Tax=Methylocystis sp. WRRC1 TaxID=1732014 RepID=UPI001D13FEDF|nr:L,D-transpeptidase family protein [Methylocystis sp. WRRC1]MCC3245957.1 L,D-transpeptidase family protein [Methylocystis sp. WRRC1]
MRACAWFSRHICASAAAIAAVVAAASASAQQNPPRRADLFAPPAAIALTGLDRAATAEPLDPILAAPAAPPIVAVLDARVQIVSPEPDGLDLAWQLLDDEHRAVALALDDWTRAPEVARDFERRRTRAAIAAGYAARGFAPFWIDANGWREGAASALSRLKDARDDGLDLRAYKLPAAEKSAPDVADELALSEAVAAYALQARGGRIQPGRLSRLIGAKTTLPDPAQAVAEVAAAGYRAGETLQAFNPPHYGYQQLREKLAELRSQRAAGLAGAERVASAEEGLQTDADPPPLKSRKRRAASAAGASTSALEAEIVANMERWRWLPRDLGDERIEVNIPDFELAVVRGGMVTHRTRVIVGKEQTPTPIFSDEMVEIIVNPSWYVPQSIIQKEWHGGVGAGYQVSYRNGQMVVRQPPGEKNALGRIKFVFPNDFAVYMHDTPSRGLFAASHRAFSHGCMRVDDPFALAGAVLGPGSGWSEARVKKLIGPSERYINLSKPLPVHIQYFTAYVDEGGRLVQRPDLYGYSARVRKALGLGG